MTLERNGKKEVHNSNKVWRIQEFDKLKNCRRGNNKPLAKTYWTKCYTGWAKPKGRCRSFKQIKNN